MREHDFLEEVERELSAEELAGLIAYEARTDRGSVLFTPLMRKMGRKIQWVSHFIQ